MVSAAETLVEGLLIGWDKRFVGQTLKAPIEKATSVPRLGSLVGKAFAAAYSSLLMQWLGLYRVERKKK
jgi:hypothetical protein